MYNESAFFIWHSACIAIYLLNIETSIPIWQWWFICEIALTKSVIRWLWSKKKRKTKTKLPTKQQRKTSHKFKSIFCHKMSPTWNRLVFVCVFSSPLVSLFFYFATALHVQLQCFVCIWNYNLAIRWNNGTFDMYAFRI